MQYWASWVSTAENISTANLNSSSVLLIPWYISRAQGIIRSCAKSDFLCRLTLHCASGTFQRKDVFHFAKRVASDWKLL